MKTYVVSLGCPKNLVDTEASVSLLQNTGCSLTDDPDEADLLIVSACSFLEAAWQETVEEVQRLSDLKGASKRLILMGCLPKHREEDLQETLPRVDHFLPTGGQALLPGIVDAWRREDAVPPFSVVNGADRFAGFEDRQLLTSAHTGYVKIAEGCSRRCSFCAIPKIRGRMVSRRVHSIVREVENLLEKGVKEVSLLAQDITSYHDEGKRFPELVEAIADTGVEWIRIYYVHPGSLSVALAKRLFAHPAVCRYLEAPVQHASDRMLRRMRRSYTLAHLRKVFNGIRSEFPDVRIRSEAIVGFPGEGEDDFDTLKRFIADAEFASLGIFTYSAEPNTPAAALDGRVPESLKRERAAELADIQQSVALGLHDVERGAVHRVLVDRRLDVALDCPDYSYAGRYYGQALEIDGEVFLRGRDLAVGDFVDVRITEADAYDLMGEVV